MDFTLTQSQKRVRAQMTQFATDHLCTELDNGASADAFNHELWRLCAQAGILSMGMPEEYPDTEVHDTLSAVMAMEGLGYGSVDNGLPFALNTHLWTIQHPIALHGTAEQKAQWLPAMARGECIGAHAMTEPEAGSDSSSISTLATPVEGGYELSGTKCMISLAPIADMFMLFATVNKSANKWGITAFLINRHQDGVHVSEPVEKMGLRNVPMGVITLTKCFVPTSSRLGPEGAGAALANHSLEYERCCILASQVGRMQKQVDDAVSFSRTREQFGKSIGQFQSVSNRVADMKVRLETTRLLLYKVAWMKDKKRSTVLESAMLKLVASENFLASSMDAMRIHGGRSYLTENHVEHDVRDALGGVLYAGTSDIQRNIIAGMLGLKTDA